MSLLVTQGSGTTLKSDTISSAHIQAMREIEFTAGSDIAVNVITTPGTAKLLSASSVPCRGLWLVAPPSNVNVVAWGFTSTVKATQTAAAWRGFPLYPGQAIAVPVSNLNLLYFDASTGEGVSAVYLTHADS